MLSSKTVLQALQDLQEITKTRILLFGSSGDCLTGGNFSDDTLSRELPSFLASDLMTASCGEFRLFKVPDESRLAYCLAVSGKDACMTGKIAVSELGHLLTASHTRIDKNHFIQNVLLKNLPVSDLQEEARKLKIKEEQPRVVFLAETADAEDLTPALTALREMYTSSRNNDFITETDGHGIAVICELSGRDPAEFLQRTAEMLHDMLNSEAMISARIAYGNPAAGLAGLPQSYKEARTALEVQKIFFPDRHISSYSSLGIGRLIYQLPVSLCEIFLNETFEKNVFRMLDEETMLTIRQFFDNNLNISETARQLYIHRNTLVYRLEKLEKVTGLDIKKFDEAMTFKIAMMVDSYVKYLDTHKIP